MKQASNIGLMGAILWLAADFIGTTVSMAEAIIEGWFSYNVLSYASDMVEWIGIVSLIIFILTFKNRIKS